MKKKLQKILYAKGVYRSQCGCQYFIRAVEMAIEKPERTQHIGRDIYRPIALEFGQKTCTVEKSISKIRDIIMKNGGEELLCEMTGGHKWQGELPYPKELIDIFAYYFENEKDNE